MVGAEQPRKTGAGNPKPEVAPKQSAKDEVAVNGKATPQGSAASQDMLLENALEDAIGAAALNALVHEGAVEGASDEASNEVSDEASSETGNKVNNLPDKAAASAPATQSDRSSERKGPAIPPPPVAALHGPVYGKERKGDGQSVAKGPEISKPIPDDNGPEKATNHLKEQLPATGAPSIVASSLITEPAVTAPLVKKDPQSEDGSLNHVKPEASPKNAPEKSVLSEKSEQRGSEQSEKSLEAENEAPQPAQPHIGRAVAAERKPNQESDGDLPFAMPDMSGIDQDIASAIQQAMLGVKKD